MLACRRIAQPARLDTISVVKACGRPGAAAYRALSAEVARIDMHRLSELPTLQRVSRTWIEQHLCAGDGLDANRAHVNARLRQYVGARSRNGRYTEVLPAEHARLQHLSAWLREPQTCDALQLVEVGLNAALHVCKVGLVLRLPETRRYAFLCVGTVDRGLKSLYVTDAFKQRAVYAGAVPYWSLAQWDQRFSVR